MQKSNVTTVRAGGSNRAVVFVHGYSGGSDFVYRDDVNAARIAAKLGDRKSAEKLDAIFSPNAPAAKKTSAKRPRSRSVDFAILTPTAVEFDTMCEELTDPEDGQDVNWPTKVGTIGEHRVAVFLSGKGQEPTATTATLVGQRYKPRWLLLVGIAGGTRKLRRGDLIVANFVYSVDYGKLLEGHFLRRPELDWMADPALSARGAVLAEGVSRPWIADVRLPRPDGKQATDSASVVGYVGSSDKVVDDLSYPMIADALKTATEIDAFEMEAAGAGISVAYTRATHNVGLLMIRGISDEPHSGDGDKDAPAAGSEQRAKWKRYASHVAAVFSRHLIASMPAKPSARRRKAKAAERAEEPETGEADGVARALVPLHAGAEIVPRDSYRKAAGLIRESELRLLLLRGLPDSGKTSALAFVVSELHRDFEHLIVIPCDRRAAIEPGYVLERLNESLAAIGRALPSEALQEQSPELLLDQMLKRIVDLDCLMVIDDVQHLPAGWPEKLLSGLSAGRRVCVIASTDRGLPGVNANVLPIPPLDDAEAVALVGSSLRARGLPYSPNEVVAKLPQALRSNPAALLAVVAQLSDTDLALWPLSSPAVDVPQRAVEEILGTLPNDARDVLALLLPIAGIQFGAAYELLGIRERLLRNFALLLDRALVTRGPATYVVPSIVAAAFRARYGQLADEMIDFLVTRCVDELREITDNDARTLALGEVVGAVASHASSTERWSACARLASDDMLTTLHAVGLWKEYTVVLQAGIKAAEALDSGDRVRLACQLSRKLYELGDRNEAEAVLDRLGHIAPGSADEARVLSHRALFHRRLEDQIADLQRSIDLHRALGHPEEVAVGWKVIGNLQFLRGERAAARQSYDEALRQFDGNGRRHAIDIAARLAMCDLQDGFADQAESRALETLKECEQLRYYAGQRPLLLTLALVADMRGDDARALKLAQDAADVPFGDPRWVRMARATTDRILKRQGGVR